MRTTLLTGFLLSMALAWTPYAWIVPQSEVTKTAPISFWRYLNPFSVFVVRQESEPRSSVQGPCDGTPGKKVGEECLHFVSTPENFFVADLFCRRQGGNLWVPTKDDLSNPFFFQKLLSTFPDIFKSISSEILLGISKEPTGGYRGVDGSELSSAPWIRTNDEPHIKNNLCSVFDYSLGHLQFLPVKCDVAKNFVCEYPFHRQVQTSPDSLPDHSIIYGGGRR